MTQNQPVASSQDLNRSIDCNNQKKLKIDIFPLVFRVFEFSSIQISQGLALSRN
jgi:hypothetical protein